MVYRRFRIQCIGRILLLGASLCLFFYFLLEGSHVAALVLGLLAAYQVYALIRYVETTNRDLSRFFETIKYSDFSQTFAGAGAGSSFDELRHTFNEVLDAFRRTRAEKEEHFRYLQTVVQHVGVGLIAFRPDGAVDLINTAAQRLMGVGQVKNMHALKRLSADQVRTLLQLKPQEKTLLKIEDRDEFLQLAVSATAFRLHGQQYTLVSLQNIQSELEEKEVEAWQNLIRVLTHEIMNSITPIASLATTANDLLTSEAENGGFDDETVGDVRDAVHTIQRRSEGLLHFVQDYRKLTRLPAPDFRTFPLTELFDRVERLMRPSLRQAHIDFHSKVEPESLELSADPEQIDQVLINLLQNAIQAVEGRDRARIALKGRMDAGGRIAIEVSDSGAGITEEAMEKIFIPFFTTKREGSGIGLSLCRQIMRLHRGTISASSKADEETVFTLRF